MPAQGCGPERARARPLAGEGGAGAGGGDRQRGGGGRGAAPRTFVNWRPRSEAWRYGSSSKPQYPPYPQPDCSRYPMAPRPPPPPPALPPLSPDLNRRLLNGREAEQQPQGIMLEAEGLWLQHKLDTTGVELGKFDNLLLCHYCATQAVDNLLDSRLWSPWAERRGGGSARRGHLGGGGEGGGLGPWAARRSRFSSGRAPRQRWATG